MNVTKRQAYRYNIQFTYSVDINYQDCINILPSFGLKNALIADTGKSMIAKMTFEKKTF